MSEIIYIWGGGEEHKTSLFKPLVATSLALALGVSVGNAYTLTGLTNNNASNALLGITSNPDTASGKEISISTSQNGGNVSLTSNTTSDSNATTINNLRFWLGASNSNTASGNAVYRINDAGTENELHVLQVNNANTTFSVANGLQMGVDGTGTLKFSYSSATDRSFTLNLLQNDTSSQNYALNGNFELEAYSASGAVFNGNFGGKGISGNVTLSAGITTNMTFTQSAKIEGTTTITNGQNTFMLQSTPAGGIRINDFFAKNVMLRGGSLIFAFANGTANDNKIFNLNTAKQIDSANQFSITGGTLVFNGAKKVYFNNDDTLNQGNGTLTLSGGAVKFIVDPTITSANRQDQAIAKGNISANNASVIFTLSNTENKTGSNPFTNSNATPPTDIYYVDGNITINNGGLSAFWDDSEGFVGKISVTNGLSQRGGLIGKNDAWITNAMTFSTIQATSNGASHLVFDSHITITGSNSIAIKATQGNSANILFKGGANIVGNITQEQNGFNKITFGKTSSITGDISTNGNISGNGGTNDIGNNLVFNNGGSITGTISVSTNGGNYCWQGYNMNSITFNGVADATITGGLSAVDGADNRGNVITFNGSGTNKIIGDLSVDWTWFGTKGKNLVTFSKGINSIIGNITSANGGKNVISFGGNQGNLTGNITSTSGGSATISFSSTSNTLTGDITSRSTNTITFTGDTNRILKGNEGKILAHEGNNTISATGKTLAIGESANQISLSADGGGASASNTITTGTLNAYFGNVSAGGSGWMVFKNTITADNGNINIQSANTKGSWYVNSEATNAITLKSGTLTIGSISSQGQSTRLSQNNFTLGESGAVVVKVTGDTTSSGDGAQNLFTLSNTGSSLSFGGNITTNSSGVTNITLNDDNIFVTLQGSNSTITTLTAKDGATNGNTLYLDATSNDSVVASINTLTNGNTLNVNFKGIDTTKSTQLTLDTSNATALKSVSVTSGTNNTLVLSGTNTMTIAEAVTIGETSGDSKGVTFDLSSGSNLTFTNNLTTQTKGITTFKLGGTNTITGTLSNSGIHNYNIMSTTTTFKYATGNDGLTFTSGENNINFLAKNSTLNWQKNNSGYTNIDISTGGTATTNLNFFESGTFANGINTTAGTTNINIYNQKSATINSEIATTEGANTSVVFKAPTQREAQVTYSTLTLSGANNALTSVTSEANAQAKIALDGAKNATIGTTTISNGASLLFAFTGNGESTVTATNGITVGNGATLGISLGGSGDKKVVANADASISFATGSTLLVDFQDNNTANGTIGNGQAFTITEGSKSIINFHGTNNGKLNAQSDNSNSIIVNGGENTVNFMGGTTAVFAGVTLTSGKNTINVYGADNSTNGIKGTVITTDVDSVSNIINLNDYATLDLKSGKDAESGSGSLTSTGTGNSVLKSELNFIGTGATYKGGFGATSAAAGSATITVGSADKAEVSGVITGVVSNSDLKFEAGNSKLTLQGASNTFKTLTTNATNGVLVLDTTSNNIDATISAPITIKQNTSLTFGLYSGSNNNYAKVSVEGLKVQSGGTLGIAIGGSGNGTREVKITGGSDNYANMFDVGSTLRIDFLQDANGSAKLGNGQPIVIGSGRKSQINFYGKSASNQDQNYNPSLEGGITLNGGSNEVNFYGDATLTGITLASGENTIRVKGNETGITGTVGVSSVGSVRNTVELEKNATLALTNGSDVGTLSNASVNVLGASTKIAGTITNASVAFKSADADLTLQAGDSTITSLTGYTAPSTYTRNGRTITRTITNTLALDDTGNTNAISATMLNAITSDNVALKFGAGNEAKTFTLQANGNTFQGVGFVSDSSNNTLEFNGTNNTITGAINIATNNDLTIKLANTTANSSVSLNLAGGLSNASGGEANVTIEGTQINATLSGGTINATTLSLGANSNTLTFQNQTATFDHVKTADSGASISGKLIADNSTVTINHLDDGNLTLGFTGENTSSVKISGDVSSGKTITLAGVVLNGATSDNTLDLTALTGTTISSKVSVGANQALSIKLGGTTTLNLSEGLDTQGTSTLSVANSTNATLTGKAVSLSTLSLGNSSSSMTLKNSQSTINSINATSGGTLKVDASSNAVLATINGNLAGNSLTINLKGTSSNSATLQLDGASNQISTLSFEASSFNNKVILNGNVDIANKVTDNTSATFDLNSSALTLGADGMEVTGGATTFNLSGASAINGTLTLNNGNVDMNLNGNSTFTLANDPTRTNNTEKLNFAFTGSNATLNVDADKLSLDTLTSNGSNTINLVTAERDTTTSNKAFKLLDIASMNGGSVKTTLFVNKDTSISGQTLGGVDAGSNSSTTYGYAYSDRVVVKAGTNSSNIVLSVVPNLDQLLDLTYSGSNGTGDSGNIALATIKKDSGVQVSSETVTIGFDVVEAQLQEVVTDENGKANSGGNYLTYFLGGAVSKGASVETQEVAQSALAVSYDLFLANFNSLNKRMGELRDNNHDNGVWARVFGGAISNDFGAGSKTQYVTTQAGYDYSLSVGDNARNYMGIAVAYGHSNTQSNTLTQKGSVFGSTQTIGLDKVSSDMVEVGLYNSYVSESGWYNDTIFKFDYIMSEFALSNDLSKMTKTNNFAMILSDEFGYRYSFGVSEKGSWYIDPQAEVGFGWFNQSDFNRSLESSFGTSTLKASQDAILTLRTRVGASLGKKFNTDKGFASLYVGAFYEYDYIDGGKTEVTSANSSSATTNNFLQQIESNGRAVLNVGSNIELTKGARLYIDVEKSFGDKQRTFMQFNLGARYSF